MSELNKLRWRCRRGTLELDLMLIRYLECVFVEADDSSQQAFVKLLTLEDTELTGYLMGEIIPQDAELANLVKVIRQLPVAINTFS